MPKVVSLRKKKAILSEYQETMNADLTGKHHGVTGQTVIRYARAAGLPVKRGKRRWRAGASNPNTRREDILAEYQETRSSVLTAEHYGVSPSTVLRYVRAEGLPVYNQCGRRPKTTAEPS